MKSKILVADDEDMVRNIVSRTFASEPCEVIKAANGVDALTLAARENPDLMILDVCMPKKTGWEVLAEMHQDPRMRLIPVIMLTGLGVEVEDQVRGLNAGADDYITKPFMPAELKAKAQCLLRRCRLDLSVNPLTRLPGSPTIEEEVERRIRGNIPFSFMYADIDDFKVYNDAYGFAAGDAVIRETATTLLWSLGSAAPEGGFVGHVGGDDFVVITEPERATRAARTAAARFDGAVASFYRDEDMRRGFVEAADRRGVKRRFSLLSLSIGGVSSRQRALGCYGRVVEIASEMKAYCKAQKSRTLSRFVFDHRRD
ncbi:MAG TPA: response regulator [Elusimicrobiota bacterium]|nr:response regulator [Elusimicrobiota bacterium]